MAIYAANHLPSEKLYGQAAWADPTYPGEPDSLASSPPSSSTSSALPTEQPVKQPVYVDEGYSLLQKVIFFGVILTCVAAYVRVTSTHDRRRSEKSAV
jgi:hypothetical protein